MTTATAQVPVVRDISIGDLTPPMNVELVCTDSGLNDLASFMETESEYGFDLESNVAKYHTERYLRTLQVGTKHKQFVVDLLALCDYDEALLKASQHGYKAKGPLARLAEAVAAPLLSRDRLKVGHALRFEYESMYWCLGVLVDNVWDTWIAEQMIYAGRMHSKSDFFSLAETVERTCLLRIDKALQSSFDLATRLTDAQIDYAALDTRIVLPVSKAQKRTMEKMGMAFIAQVEMDALPCFGDMRVHGIHLNPKLAGDYVASVKKAHQDNIAALDAEFLPIVGQKDIELPNLELLEYEWKAEVTDKAVRQALREKFYAARKLCNDHRDNYEKYEGQARINYGSGPELIKALRKLGVNLSNTDDSTLEKNASHKAVAALREYRTTGKVLSTYGDSFIQKINPVTGRTHPTINQIGAATGRTSADNYNSQNLPPEVRACITAQDEDYILGTFDMAGAELRILTEISGEPSWVDAFSKDWDVHSMCSVMLRPEEWKSGTLEGCKFAASYKKCKCPAHLKIRGGLKEINFGIPYGMEEKSLAEKMKVALKEARSLLSQHRAEFKVTHASLHDMAESAKIKLYARTLGGRVRYFTKPTWEKAKEKAIERAKKDKRDPNLLTSKDIGRSYYSMFGSIEREGKNTPIQGTNADIAKKAMGLMWRRLHEMGVKLINFVHDEFVFELHKSQQEELETLVKWAIRHAGTFFMKKVYMDSEGVFDYAWKKP